MAAARGIINGDYVTVTEAQVSELEMKTRWGKVRTRDGFETEEAGGKHFAATAAGKDVFA